MSFRFHSSYVDVTFEAWKIWMAAKGNAIVYPDICGGALLYISK